MNQRNENCEKDLSETTYTYGNLTGIDKAKGSIKEI